ncbi:uncharacterized protein K441DRAFT_743830 [Cenococcum geophilum 1.58]|uniref:Uncharacterized protein n=1 Tax=Cenococcum geophilum 1.58 TaxID=794803 RepID=A0ACC8ELH1_9PEZI|nr:hypothetical protein K441DRAFT_743830 [Cenococcum geophilum 1.58]
MDPASAVLSEGLDPLKPKTYAALSESSNVPLSTVWHRVHVHGRRSTARDNKRRSANSTSHLRKRKP